MPGTDGDGDGGGGRHGHAVWRKELQHNYSTSHVARGRAAARWQCTAHLWPDAADGRGRARTSLGPIGALGQWVGAGVSLKDAQKHKGSGPGALRRLSRAAW